MSASWSAPESSRTAIEPAVRGATDSPKGAQRRARGRAFAGVARDELDRRLGDLRLQRGGRALGDDRAAIDDPDAVGQHVGLLEVLRRQEDGRALLTRQARDLVPQRGARLHVEAGRRLVEEEDARAVQQRQREVQPALHAARVGRRPAIGGVGEADALEQLVAAAAALGARDALQPALQAHVLAAGQHRVERHVLQRDADRGAHLGSLLRDVVARDGRPARGRRQQRREHLDGRRLAGAVGAEEAVDLARRHVQVDPVDGAHAALELADEALHVDSTLFGHGRQPTQERLRLSTVASIYYCVRQWNPGCKPSSAIEDAWALMGQLFWQVRPRLIRVAGEFGLSPPQLFALKTLDPDNPMPMSALAAALHCDNSNVTGLVDGLEAQGLVERRPGEHDRRVRMLVVTAGGAEVRARVAAVMQEVPPELAALSGADQRALRDILKRALG